MGVRVGFLQGSVGFLQRAFIKVNSKQWQSIPTAFMFNPLHLEIIVGGGDLFDKNQLFRVVQAVSYGQICKLRESKADFG